MECRALTESASEADSGLAIETGLLWVPRKKRAITGLGLGGYRIRLGRTSAHPKQGME